MSHKQFVLRVLLPSIKPPVSVWRITAEAYLTGIWLGETQKPSTFEQALSDGSTLVPDLAYRWGNIKDPWGVAHDLIYIHHKLGLSDAYGVKWTLHDAHNMYRRGWLATGMPIVGSVWYLGLVLGGWVVWNQEFDNKPEKVSQIIWF